MNRFDVAVTGAGVFGCWIAYRLVSEGKRVALVDAYGAGNSRASSGGETRILRFSYGADEIYTRMAMRAFELWGEFLHGCPETLFHATGALVAAAAGDAMLDASGEAMLGAGARFETLDSEQLRRRFPQMSFPAESAALFEPSSGALLARRLTSAVAAAARQKGAEILCGRVETPSGAGRLPCVITSAGPPVEAETFVFACGPWLASLFPQLLGEKIFPTRQEVFFFGIPAGDTRFGPHALPVWLDRTDPRLPYGIPDIENRGVKVAFDLHGPPFDPDSGERIASTESAAAAREYLARRFPALKGAPLVESRVCQYENTSSGDFLIDRHPEFDNVWIAGGGSGHGFKHGPAVGEYVADVLAGRRTPEPRFRLAAKQTKKDRTVY
jgi:sarcosine oxidase